MWSPHPVYQNYQANDVTGEIKSTKGIRALGNGFLTLRYQKEVTHISGAKFVFECFEGLIETQYIIDLEDEGKGLKLSNLVKVTKDEKIHRDLAKIEAVRARMEATGEWKTHPTFDHYLGSRQGEVFSLTTQASLKGRKSGPYEFIAMNLTRNDENTYITQHKFIFECFNGLLNGECDLSHCNLIESDNALSNLKLLTEEEEMKTFSDDEWYVHPKYQTYAADTGGNIYNIDTKQKLNYLPNAAGYIEVKLYIDGQGSSVLGHRFVYECFHGLIDAGIEIDHRNTQKSQNMIGNLTALTRRAHAKKTRRDNPHMSEKRATTCSKAILRIELNDEKMVAATVRYDSAKLAVVAGGSGHKAHAIRDAIQKRTLYKGYYWQYDLPADLPGEVWKTLKHDHRTFVVSSEGRVKTSYGASFGSNSGQGYLSIGFGNSHYRVHLLVCLAFHGSAPPDLVDPTVDHRDGVRSNNTPTNLRWADRALQGLNRVSTKKVLGYQRTDPTKMFGPFDSITLAGKEMSVSPSSIISVCKGNRLSAGSHAGAQLAWKYVD